MRNDDRFKHVPIIMITSRTGDKHRERARQIGVNVYLGKPYQENDLLNSIHHIIGVADAGAVA
jgi:chemosensory pili system protein ChpA (sensor histidine kinase/response regulator)